MPHPYPRSSLCSAAYVVYVSCGLQVLLLPRSEPFAPVLLFKSFGAADMQHQLTKSDEMLDPYRELALV